MATVGIVRQRCWRCADSLLFTRVAKVSIPCSQLRRATRTAQSQPRFGKPSGQASGQPNTPRREITWLTAGIISLIVVSVFTSIEEIIKSENKRFTLTSTLPLHAVGRPKYDLSDKNLKAAHREFVKLLGPENVDLRRGELISRSSTEWSPAPNGEADIPSMIVFPRSTQDVSEIAKICHAKRIPMIGFSGGTSLEGTLAAQHKEVCVDFNRYMNKVLMVRSDDLDVTVQPSVGYQELNQMLAEKDLFFPVDPGPGAQIGGMIAQGCSGTNAYRYGTMKDWVLGLEVVLADGTIIKTRGRARKSSSGYDMTRLFTGSEGTLGFVTQAHLKLTRTPQNLRVAVAQFPSVVDAVKMAVTVLQSGHQLEAMELLDELTMHAVNESGYCTTTWAEKPTLFFKLAGPSADTVKQTAKTVEQLAKNCKSTLFKLAKDAEEADELWHARKTALWSTLALKKDPSDKFVSADACVPISRLGDIIEKSQKLLEGSHMFGSFLGHVGDGNFHTTVLYNDSEKEIAKSIIADVQRMGVDMDGTVSGEHGIGLEYRDQVVYELGEDSVDAMRRIKFALDPLCLMNPGKMIRVEEENPTKWWWWSSLSAPFRQMAGMSDK